MLNIIVNGARVSYDSLEEAKEAAQASGRGLAFWRETLSACAENEAMWNDLLNDLWQSGAENEAERLDRTFPKDAPRHWLLVALTLDGGDPWRAFLAAWEARGDGWILPVVSAPAFVPWLKQVQPERHGLLVRAFGADSAKWPNDLLPQALKAEGTAAEVSEWRAVVEERKGPKPGEEMTITLPGGVPNDLLLKALKGEEGIDLKNREARENLLTVLDKRREPDMESVDKAVRERITDEVDLMALSDVFKQWNK